MIEFWELAPSPNSTKVRMALRYKGLDFEARPVDPADRSAVIELSGQELTPVIRDGTTVLNDSEAILQYLDANYRETPRLWPTSRAARKDCDSWKTILDQRVVPSWLPVFLHAVGRGDKPGPETAAQFRDALAWLEETLDGEDSFHDRAVCDLRVAEWTTYAMPSEAVIKRVPLFRRCRKAFAVADDEFPGLRRFVEPWNQRLA